MIENRRQCKRFGLQLPALISRPESSRSYVIEIRNMSAAGFFGFTEEPFNIGETLYCRIALLDPLESDEHKEAICIDGEFEVIHLLADTSRSSFGLGCRIRQMRIVPAQAELFHMSRADDSRVDKDWRMDS